MQPHCTMRFEGTTLKHIANHLADVRRFLIFPQLRGKYLPNSGKTEKDFFFFFLYPSVVEITTHPFTLGRLKVTHTD